MAIPLLRILFTLSVFLCAVICVGQNQRTSSASPAAFIKNEGQIIDQTGKHNEEVLYLLNTPGLNVQLRKKGFSYDVYEVKKSALKSGKPIQRLPVHLERLSTRVSDSATTLTFHRVDLEFLNISDDLVIQECEASSAYTNYYNVPGREEGITGVTSFKRIIYKNLYRGIDVEFFIPSEKTKPVEYNFVVQPGADISAIKMKISGAEVNLKDNTLNMQLVHGNLKEIIPKSWIKTNEKEKEVAVTYTNLSKDTFGFKVANSEKVNAGILIIDPTPVREWATYFGGEDTDTADRAGLATDPAGNVFFAGITRSHTNIATSDRPESLHEGDSMGFLAKFDPDGNLIWSIYYGGYRGAGFYDLAIDSAENLVAVGATTSENNIATPGAHQTSIPNAYNHGSGIMVKFDKNGNRIWGTYYGGQSADYFLAVAVDAEDNIYGAGNTGSNDNIATADAFRNAGDLIVHFNTDAFIVKMNKNGVRQWATYYGGLSHDNTNSLDVDSKGNVIMTGDTGSLEGIATPGTYQEIYANGGYSWNDAFVAKISPTGQLIWGTYFGGEDYDFGNSVAVDGEDHILLTGYTRNNHDIASPGAHQEIRGSIDYNAMTAYLAKFTPHGQLAWSTYYGGENGSGGSVVRVTAGNDILLYGSSGSTTNISTTDAFQPSMAGSVDVFLAKFNPAGKRIWGSYYGGENWDESHNMALTPDGVIYISGRTYSTTGISTPGAHQENKNEAQDAFLVKFKDCLSSFTTNIPTGACAGEDLVLSASGATIYLWTGPNGFTSTLANPVITNTQAVHSGTYYLSLSSGNGCDDTRSFEIEVSQPPSAFPVSDLTDCEAVYNTGISNGFDLEPIKAQVLGNQTGMLVEFFDGNGNKLQSLSTPFINSFPHRETITVRVADPDNPGCFAETDFDLIVQDIPPDFSVANIITCDTDADGIAETDLSDLTHNLIGNNNDIEISYYDMHKDLVELSSTGTFTNSVPFRETLSARATLKSTGCYTEAFFDVLVGPAPVAHPLQDLVGCDDDGDGISEYFDVSGVTAEVLQDQNGMEVSYYRSDGSMISNFTSPYTNLIPFEETIKVRLTSPGTGCFNETSLLLKTSAAPQIISPGIIYSCNEGNGIGSYNTSTWTQQIIGTQTGLKVTYYNGSGDILPTPLPVEYRNSTAFAETITVKVENDQNKICVSETEFQLVVNSELNMNLDDSYSICGTQAFLELKMEEPFDTWEWQSEQGEILSTTSNVVLREEGIYSLRVGKFENGILCEKVRSFSLVRSVLPYIQEVDVQDWSSSNFIRIVAEGDGDFEYSIDGNNYFDTNYFGKLSGGTFTVYVRDKNGCGIATQEVILIDYPKFFSPNNDGQNDQWQLQGFSQQPEAFILIFDRYGKLLKQLSSHSPGWDGTFNGRLMPADDYWFRITMADGKTFGSHFSLLR